MKKVKTFTCLFVCLLALASVRSAMAAPSAPFDADRDLFSEEVGDDYLCPTRVTLKTPNRCSVYSPGAYQAKLTYLRARLPDPLPELSVEEIEVEEGAISPYTFAYVRPLPAPTYGHPEEAAVGMPPIRQFMAGDNWVSVMGSVEYNGQLWYEINEGEFIAADHIAIANPSRFTGVVLSEQPAYPFGWMNRTAYPSSVPGGATWDDVLLYRYDLITIFAQQAVGGEMWYMVGPDQWLPQTYTARVDIDPRPEGVGPHDKWIEVNTFEQTLAAYEGDRMVFATLTSTGTSHHWTPDGLTKIWGKLPSTPMINRDVGPDSPLYYYLEHVEWTQYFNGAYAIHAAYWHDSFSFTRSHGCVNMTITDAKWLFGWTTPYAPEDAKIVYSGSNGADQGTWVWIHRTPPMAGL